MKNNPGWILERVRRYVPPPTELYHRVKTVFDAYEQARDATTGNLLCTEAVKNEMRTVLNQIESGVVSDPPGISLYRFVRLDKNRLAIYRSCRGTNSTESMHSNLMSHFGSFNVSPRFANCLLREFRHRYNIGLARLHRPGTIHFGHVDTWIIDQLQTLEQKLKVQ
jgi:hypothetical protein